jgi:hypothetical protein
MDILKYIDDAMEAYSAEPKLGFNQGGQIYLMNIIKLKEQT